jgi:two-component system sensor histidine kinase DegS
VSTPSEGSSALSTALIIQTQEEERYRLARRLVNGPAQLLANAVFEIEHCIPLLDSEPQVARTGLQALLDELKQGLDDFRDLVADLQPPLLAELGLAKSIERYVERFGQRYAITLRLAGWETLPRRLPSTLETAIFRIIQEALNNVRLHSGASIVEIQAALDDQQILITISDNGRGFILPDDTPLNHHRQLGLVGMRDRAQAVGGQLQIFTEPRHGVRVVVRLPYQTPHLSENFVNSEHVNSQRG